MCIYNYWEIPLEHEAQILVWYPLLSLDLEHLEHLQNEYMNMYYDSHRITSEFVNIFAHFVPHDTVECCTTQQSWVCFLVRTGPQSMDADQCRNSWPASPSHLHHSS